jgi:hypothetical protein
VIGPGLLLFGSNCNPGASRNGHFTARSAPLSMSKNDNLAGIRFRRIDVLLQDRLWLIAAELNRIEKPN